MRGKLQGCDWQVKRRDEEEVSDKTEEIGIIEDSE